LNNFVIEDSTKSKLKFYGKVGHILGTVEKALDEPGYCGGDFVIFRPMMQDICTEYISCCNLLLQSKIESPITKHILIIEQFSMFSSFFN
jgi:hypothetical protein